ncbi:GNAT family N-acetyltransferase [Sulfitobacter sp. 1A16787]|uniref:GNAT family N-acetyltransferase n=1 Tax=Sulfitobacter sp. 1A16787 TaxID=3368571 RepID=UPI003745E1F4
MTQYIVATDRPWAVQAFIESRNRLPGEWLLVTSAADLEAAVARLTPRYVFFPHWSHIVPRVILERVECVCFHMSDVPYGRGGSPLQNLILRGHRSTVLTALRMTDDIDAGPVYAKQPLSLEGSAEEVFQRAAVQTVDVIAEIVQHEPIPTRQLDSGALNFARRKPLQSALPGRGDIEGIYDHIRMLDAPGYPKAYIDHGPFRITLSGAKLGEDGSAFARAQITENIDLANLPVTLRSVEIADCGRIYRWRYAGNSSRFYLTSDVPNYQEHVAWVTKNLAAEDRKLLVGQIDGLAVSHIRLDHGASETEVSIYVDPGRRGMRIGYRSLHAAIQLHHHTRGDKLVARLHRDNVASVKLFSTCGFVEMGRKNDFVLFEFPVETTAAEKQL